MNSMITIDVSQVAAGKRGLVEIMHSLSHAVRVRG
jgi:hypothetical protein